MDRLIYSLKFYLNEFFFQFLCNIEFQLCLVLVSSVSLVSLFRLVSFAIGLVSFLSVSFRIVLLSFCFALYRYPSYPIAPETTLVIRHAI